MLPFTGLTYPCSFFLSLFQVNDKLGCIENNRHLSLNVWNNLSDVVISFKTDYNNIFHTF